MSETDRVRIIVTGSTGLIGSHLVPRLRAEGHEVLRLVRREAAQPDEVSWDPLTGDIDTRALRGVDAAVHLAGAGIGDRRWTTAYKRELLDSRVRGTTTIATALASLDPLPKVLVSAAAIGYYGDTGDREIDESSPRGEGFLSELVEVWEQSTAPAQRSGIRVATVRSGLVVAGKGGTWGRLIPLFRLGLGGRLGSGRQYWSFISIEDEVRAIQHVLAHDTLRGPVNLTAPHPLTNSQITAVMGRILHRPTLLPVPAFALRAVVGEFAGDILGGQKVLPRKLLESGFTFEHPEFEDAFNAAL